MSDKVFTQEQCKAIQQIIHKELIEIINTAKYSLGQTEKAEEVRKIFEKLETGVIKRMGTTPKQV